VLYKLFSKALQTTLKRFHMLSNSFQTLSNDLQILLESFQTFSKPFANALQMPCKHSLRAFETPFGPNQNVR